MPQWLISLIGVAVGALLTLVTQYQASRVSQWKLLEDRKTDYTRKREPLYGKALEFIYSIEGAQNIPEGLAKLHSALSIWLMSEAFLLPPKGKDILFRLIFQLGERVSYLEPGVLTSEEKQSFNNTLREAKDYFIKAKDIAYIPEELNPKAL